MFFLSNTKTFSCYFAQKYPCNGTGQGRVWSLLSPIPRPLGKGDPTTPTTVARVPDPTPPPNSPSHPWGLFAAPDSAPPPRWRACGSRVLALGATALLANTSFLLGSRGVQQVTRFPIQTTTRILCFQFIVNFPPLHQNQWYVLALDWGIFQITENSISNFQPLHSTPPPLPQRGDEARAGLAGLNQQFPRPPPAKPLPRGGGGRKRAVKQPSARDPSGRRGGPGHGPRTAVPPVEAPAPTVAFVSVREA